MIAPARALRHGTLVGHRVAPKAVDSRPALGHSRATPRAGRITMAWTTPKIEEVTCGMEINMYFPAEDDPILF
jgi:coenzyme PQQ precursor peptide PqqA